MTYKVSVDSQLRGFWYAPNGSDESSGESLEVPFLTIQAGIDAAAALIPPPSFNLNGFVTAAQGGIFDEPFVLVDSVNLNGLECVLETDTDVTATMASNLLFNFTGLINSQAGGITLMCKDVIFSAVEILFLSVTGEGGICMDISGNTGSFASNCSSISITADNGIGYNITSTMFTPIDLKTDVASLSSTGATFMIYNPVDDHDECVVNVSTIESNFGTDTVGFIVKGGHLVIESTGIIHANMVIRVESGAFVDMNAAHVHGDIIVDEGGELNILILDHSEGEIINNGVIHGNINGRNYGDYLDDYDRILTSVSGDVLVSEAGNLLISDEGSL